MPSPAFPEVRYDNAYPNVIYDEEAQLYRLYYTLIIYDPESPRYTRQERAKRNYIPKHDRRTATGYAESKDGIHWTKPNLGIVEFQGSKDNNLIMLSAHGTGVMLDKEELNPKRRYKMMLMLDVVGVESRMAVSFSADGITGRSPLYGPSTPPGEIPTTLCSGIAGTESTRSSPGYGETTCGCLP